ncbi:unnamed protein product, partial [Ilex paraguariensis]
MLTEVEIAYNYEDFDNFLDSDIDLLMEEQCEFENVSFMLESPMMEVADVGIFNEDNEG